MDGCHSRENLPLVNIMYQNSYLGIISKTNKGHSLRVCRKKEYTHQQGDLVFKTPSIKSLHINLVEAMEENDITEIDITKIQHNLSSRQISYIKDRNNFIDVYVSYHMYPNMNSVYTIIIRTREKIEYVYKSEELCRTGIGLEKYLTRAVSRVEHKFKKTAWVHSTIQIPTKNTTIVMPWEHNPTLLRADSLCRGEVVKFPMKEIVL